MLAFLFELSLLLLHILKILYQRLSRPESPFSHPHHRLSKPHSSLKPSYDVVVIGSGYGGSIAASRLSRASPKQSVCVLERGLERWPGEFPNNARSAIPQLRFSGWLFGSFWVDVGRVIGLYKWVLGKASSVLVGNGLGGTSLINAGVWLRPEKRVFEGERWPQEITKDPSVLDEYFERAEKVLEPQTWPEKRAARKFDVLKQQAEAVELGKRCEKVKLMMKFEDGVNQYGVRMRGSGGEGQECMGCNDGSKNDCLATYLSDAESWGAEIFCGCEVSHVTKHPKSGYVVYYRRLVSDDPGLQEPYGTLHWVHAKRFVFLGAGSIGTTEILLRSGENGLSLSPCAGSGMTSNGSMLAFGHDLDYRVDAVGQPRRSLRSSRPAPGPTIVGTIDCRDTEKVERSFIIQDGAFPTAMALLFRLVHWLLPSVKAPRTSIWRKMKKWMSGRDPLKHSQVYLVLGHDNSGGKMTLKNGKPFLDMIGIRDHGHLATAKNLLVKMTHALGGTFKGQGVKVTVHLLGGMCMASDGTPQTGATNHLGEVFAGASSAVHGGLVVVDGSFIPTSLGANPVATITALAERSVDLLTNKAGLVIDFDDPEPRERQSRVQNSREAVIFSETMEGHIANAKGSSKISLAMTIQAYRVGHVFEGSVTGSLYCPGLSLHPLQIETGVFKLFEDDEAVAVGKKMSYHLRLVDSGEVRYTFRGTKCIGPSIAFSPRRAWVATTTMNAVIEIDDQNDDASALLRLRPRSFLRQLRSLHVVAPNAIKQRRLLKEFVSSFAASLMSLMLIPFAPLQYPTGESVDPSSNRLTRPLPSAKHTIQAKDGFATTLRMWNPQTFSVGKDILFVPGGAVTHEIYALSTIRKNAIEHFTSVGYRCWCVTHRAATVQSRDRKYCWTTYDARLDVEAALRRIREENEERQVFVIAHCVGSGALASGLLDGTIPSQWIRGIVTSQFFLHPLVSPLNQWKARLPLVSIYRMLAGTWYACDSKADGDLVQRLLNQLLRFYPHTSRQELCTSNLCHRADLPFGRLWNHANLNRETHERLHDLFSGVSTGCIEHLARMGLKATLTDNGGREVRTEENLDRLKGVPVFLMVGNDNQAYQPKATLLTFQLLRDRFGEDMVRRKVFEGLAHLDCWMSDAAARPGTVFETIEKELERMEWGTCRRGKGK